MNLKGLKNTLLFIFLSSLLIELILIIMIRQSKKVYPDSEMDLLVLVLQIYSIPFTVILAATFAPGHKKPQAPKQGTTITIAAIAVSSIWNLLYIWLFANYLIYTDIDVSDLKSTLTSVSGYSSFLTAGVLSYFFSAK